MKARRDLFISGSTLKMIAVVTMLIDHVAAYLLSYDPDCMRTLFTVMGEPVSIVSAMRFVGRLAFPIFCFLLVEGFEHTRNRSRYGMYLLLFALLSEIPFDLAQSDGWNPYRQNVFFSLWLGYLGIYLPSLWSSDFFNRALCLMMITVAVICCQSDYGLLGFLFILSMYHMRRGLIGKMIAGTVLLPNPMGVAMATLPIGLYNGQRGFITGNWMKYSFYAFYPVHLAVIFCIRNYCLD